MKISKLWLDTFFDTPLPNAAELSDALTFHVFEIDGVDKVGNDDILDVKITANRGHDCLSHRGIAKELSAILKLPLARDPFSSKSNLDIKTDAVTVKIDTPLCKRYIAGYVKGVKVGPSPQWLKDRLEALGQRSVNNVVDATNFVMFDIGQPLHAFDAGKVGKDAEGKYFIEVRNALLHESVEDLTGKEYTLEPNNLVIGSYDYENLVNGLPMPTFLGIAGVKGGMPAAIDESTTDIVIESANFDGVSVRKTAAALKLRTDASARFEQVLSPELAAYGMRSVVDLIVELAGGEVQGFADAYPAVQPPQYANVTVEKINKVLGTQLTGADVADVFTRLGFGYKEEAGVFEVQIPPERLDIVIAEDLVEEVGRIVGYDKVPATPLPPFAGQVELNKNFYAAEAAREEWMGKGYSEVFTSVFADKGERLVLNKIDGVKPYLRTSLTQGLTDALAKNKPNKDLLGLKEIKLFEIGTVWKDGREVLMLGSISEKEKPVEVELAGNVSPKTYEALPLSQAEKFQPFSKYPYIVRDIAMWTPEGTDPVEVEKMIKTGAGELCQKVSLFDTFTKEGRTSLAFRLIFQSFEKTLTETEANSAMEKVSALLEAKGFEIR